MSISYKDSLTRGLARSAVANPAPTPQPPAPTPSERDAKYRATIEAANKAKNDAWNAWKDTCFDCLRQEAKARGISEVTGEIPWRVYFIAPCRNGNTRISVEVENGWCLYEVGEETGRFGTSKCLTTGATPGELFDRLAETPCDCPIPGTESVGPVRVCAACEGTGVAYYDDDVLCTSCNGTGAGLY